MGSGGLLLRRQWLVHHPLRRHAGREWLASCGPASTTPATRRPCTSMAPRSPRPAPPLRSATRQGANSFIGGHGSGDGELRLRYRHDRRRAYLQPALTATEVARWRRICPRLTPARWRSPSRRSTTAPPCRAVSYRQSPKTLLLRRAGPSAICSPASFNDKVDAGSSLSGVLITINPLTTAQGVWQYSTNSGGNWRRREHRLPGLAGTGMFRRWFALCQRRTTAVRRAAFRRGAGQYLRRRLHQRARARRDPRCVEPGGSSVHQQQPGIGHPRRSRRSTMPCGTPCRASFNEENNCQGLFTIGQRQPDLDRRRRCRWGRTARSRSASPMAVLTWPVRRA